MLQPRSIATFVFALYLTVAGQLFLFASPPAMSQTPGVRAAVQAPADQLTQAERRYLVTELKETKVAYLQSIRSLTQQQWTFKPAPDRWSVEECAEHIILAEPLLVADAKRMLAAPAAPRLPTANSDGDHLQVAKMLDRTATAKAPAAITPGGRFATPEQAAREFIRRRDATIAYAETTQDPLRSHSGAGPAGDTNDAYQVLLLLAAHSGRHTAQIFEVEAGPTFPRVE